jgi:hypothetical protein
MSSILLPGNSRASIEILESAEFGLHVKKTCTGDTSFRLIRQIEKQKEFKNSERIRSPKVFDMKISKFSVEASMEYVRGQDFISFTNTASKKEFDLIVGILIDLIREEFKESIMTEFPIDIWNSKVNSVLRHCVEKHVFSQLDVDHIDNFLNQDLPKTILLGKCHGDLTFSNVIVETSNSVCIFDFLDPPISTPYEDAAKFLQDAQFFWSINKYIAHFDDVRVKIYWSHAADVLRDSLSEICDFELLRKFQVLGLLRILPYTEDESMIKFLADRLIKEVKK